MRSGHSGLRKKRSLWAKQEGLYIEGRLGTLILRILNWGVEKIDAPRFVLSGLAYRKMIDRVVRAKELRRRG